ncbi:MAG: bifunctional phosphoribosylaminoimidazolecarboxamide formyltransferase/IMP cyclohydrolase [Phycisphaerales bacterium]
MSRDGLVRIRRALVSVSDKTDLVPFVRGLIDHGVETIISTGGTARALAEAGIDVVSVETLTGFPEMMDGRVKTLHPAVHGAVLARRDEPSHVAAMAEHGIEPIDLVCINLYPFEQTIADPDTTPDEAIEQIDIGGPAMLRSASKNHAHVAVVTAAQQYDDIVRELAANEGSLAAGTRQRLAAAAFMRTAAYDTAISAWMGELASAERREIFPDVMQGTWSRQRILRYGENPHQDGAVYADPIAGGPSVVTADVLGGKALSYNNMADASAAALAVRDLSRSRAALVDGDSVSAAVIKHTNPCGLASRATAVEAFVAAHDGDTMAAYGGILALSAPLDPATASAIVEHGSFFEVVIAPDFVDDAAGILSRKWKNVRVLRVPGLLGDTPPARTVRSVLGGVLVQDRDDRLADARSWRHVAGPAPDEAMAQEAITAWIAAKHGTSNAVSITRAGMLLGIGTGQVDRVSACRLAIGKAGERIASTELTGPVVAGSDAFFPFPDGPELLIAAGVNCLVHPGGSMRDAETNAVGDAHGVTVLHTGVRHFRH